LSARPRSDARCSRNSRSSGLRLRVSSGDRDLDERADRGGTPRLSLGELLRVVRAGLVLVKAELQGVAQPLQLE